MVIILMMILFNFLYLCIYFGYLQIVKKLFPKPHPELLCESLHYCIYLNSGLGEADP